MPRRPDIITSFFCVEESDRSRQRTHERRGPRRHELEGQRQRREDARQKRNDHRANAALTRKTWKRERLSRRSHIVGSEGNGPLPGARTCRVERHRHVGCTQSGVIGRRVAEDSDNVTTLGKRTNLGATIRSGNLGAKMLDVESAPNRLAGFSGLPRQEDGLDVCIMQPLNGCACTRSQAILEHDQTNDLPRA